MSSHIYIVVVHDFDKEKEKRVWYAFEKEEDAQIMTDRLNSTSKIMTGHIEKVLVL